MYTSLHEAEIKLPTANNIEDNYFLVAILSEIRALQSNLTLEQIRSRETSLKAEVHSLFPSDDQEY